MIEDLLSDLENILLPNMDSKCKSDMPESIKYNSEGQQGYTIIKNTNRQGNYDVQGWIILNGLQYEIIYWCNIDALIQGDYKTADYLLTYLGLRIQDFEIKDLSTKQQRV